MEHRSRGPIALAEAGAAMVRSAGFIEGGAQLFGPVLRTHDVVAHMDRTAWRAIDVE
jgi:hypothetical protein